MSTCQCQPPKKLIFRFLATIFNATKKYFRAHICGDNSTAPGLRNQQEKKDHPTLTLTKKMKG